LEIWERRIWFLVQVPGEISWGMGEHFLEGLLGVNCGIEE